MISEQELQERRDNRKAKVDNSYWAINENRKQNKPPTIALRTLSHDAQEVASCELRLGHVRSAREWFARAAYADRSYLSIFKTRWDELPTSTQSRGGIRTLDGVGSAVLSGDGRLIDAMAKQILTLSVDFPTEFGGYVEHYWKACTTASILEGDTDSADEYRNGYLNTLDEISDHTAALSQTHQGLILDDKSTVHAGIQGMVDYHERIVEDLPRQSEVVNLPSAVHLLIARDREMDIRVDSEYLPTALDEYGIGEHIDLPVPEYLDEDLRVD